MSWTNVKLIFGREVRDQLRDRRTLFMIAVLPLLLYPLLGMSFLQVMQFMQERPTKVLVIGDEQLQDLDAPLFETNEQGEMVFDHDLFEGSTNKTAQQKARLLQVTFETPDDDDPSLTPQQRFKHQQEEAHRRTRQSD